MADIQRSGDYLLKIGSTWWVDGKLMTIADVQGDWVKLRWDGPLGSAYLDVKIDVFHHLEPETFHLMPEAHDQFYEHLRAVRATIDDLRTQLTNATIELRQLEVIEKKIIGR